jgi:hypothetical protein
MFLGLATFETLDETGQLSSYIMAPSEKGSPLVVDNIHDVDRSFSRSSIDVGPLRVYADQKGLAFRYISSRLGGAAFAIEGGGHLRLALEHRDVPVEPNHAGYYGILMPKNFVGDVKLSIKVRGREQADSPRRVFLTDTKQIFVSSDFRVYYEEPGAPIIKVEARLHRGDIVEGAVKEATFAETFGGYIDGLHDTSVADLIREINRSIAPDIPQVFICHSSSDKALARRLAHALSGKGVRVWIDEAEIKTGDSLIDKIESGIFSSRNLIVLMTANSVASRWCKEELRMALALQINGERIRVLPALFEECEIPGFLLEKAYADFRGAENFDAGIADLFAAIGMPEPERRGFKDRILSRWRSSQP